MAIFDALIQPALKAVTDLISQFHMSPEEKLQAQQAIADAAQKAQLASMDYDVQLNKIASDNIQSEVKSGSWFTRDARPSVIWMGNMVLIYNYIFAPMMHRVPVNFPDLFWYYWGAVTLGYVTARGMEKISAMPGNSQVSLMGGLLKVGQDSGVKK